jgi:hypothetical protein
MLAEGKWRKRSRKKRKKAKNGVWRFVAQPPPAVSCGSSSYTSFAFLRFSRQLALLRFSVTPLRCASISPGTTYLYVGLPLCIAVVRYAEEFFEIPVKIRTYTDRHGNTDSGKIHTGVRRNCRETFLRALLKSFIREGVNCGLASACTRRASESHCAWQASENQTVRMIV